MFGNGQGLQPTDVSAIRDLAEFERVHPGVNNRAHQALLDKAKALANCRNLMAPNATIVVLNCHALESPAGRKFMEDIGDALMGTKGGRLIASSDLIETMQLGPETGKLDWLMKSLKTGRWLQAGDTAYGAHWESIMIHPGSFPKMPASLLAATGEDKLRPATGVAAQFQGNWQKPDSNITITASGGGMSATEKGSNTSSNHWGSSITFSKIDGNVAHGKAQGKYSDQDKDITTVSTVTFTLRDHDHLDTHWVVDDAKAVWHPGVSPYTSAVHTGAIFDNQYTRK